VSANGSVASGPDDAEGRYVRISANYAVAVDGNFSLVFGSVITLINDARIAAGKKPVDKSNDQL